MSEKNVPVFDETGARIGMASENAEVETVFEKMDYRTSLPRRREPLVERIVLSGFDFSQQSDWHNLTDAITSGAPIDFEKLDGREIKIAHKNGSEVYTTIEREHMGPIDDPEGWSTTMGVVYGIFDFAWDGEFSWTLWLDGEIPMKRKTADQLEPGMGFKGSFPDLGAFPGIVIEEDGAKLALPIAYAPPQKPDKVEVLEEYGIGMLKGSGDDA